MSMTHPRSTARIFGHPIHPVLVPFPIVCFVGTLVTDVVYWRTAAMQWETFSVWLLTAGLLMGGLAGLAGVVDYLGDRRVRQRRSAAPHALGNGLVMLLSLVNVFVHSRDGYTSVVPDGLILSTAVVLILIVTSWLGGELVYRDHVGVSER